LASRRRCELRCAPARRLWQHASHVHSEVPGHASIHLLSHLSSAPAKVAQVPATPPAQYEDTVEIELTAEQMDALLSGR